MSDTTPIQSTPTPEQGAQTPLSADAAAGRVRGTDADQNQMSFSRGPEVAASSRTSERGYSVSGVEVAVKHVDQRCIEGSYAGDSRNKPGDVSAPSLAKAANGNGPRGAAGQFPNGHRDQTLGSFSKDSANQNFPGSQADSEAGN